MNLFRNLALAVVATGFGLLSAADPALIKLIPQDATFIAGIHADQIKNSRFGQYILDQLKDEDAKLNKFITSTGFDPRRDLTELVVAGKDGQKHGQMLVIAKGRFDAARIRAFAQTEGANKLVHQGVDILTGKHSEAGGLAFLDANTAVAGGIDYVKAVIDRGKQSAAVLDPKIANRITELSTRYDAWMLSASLAHLNPKLEGAMNGKFMQGMQSVLGGVRFGANVELMAEATMRSEKDASSMVDVMQFLSSMVRMNRDNDPKAAEAAELLERVDAKANGNQFRMLLTLPEDALERMVKPAVHKKRRHSDDVI